MCNRPKDRMTTFYLPPWSQTAHSSPLGAVASVTLSLALRASLKELVTYCWSNPWSWVSPSLALQSPMISAFSFNRTWFKTLYNFPEILSQWLQLIYTGSRCRFSFSTVLIWIIMVSSILMKLIIFCSWSLFCIPYIIPLIARPLALVRMAGTHLSTKSLNLTSTA